MTQNNGYVQVNGQAYPTAVPTGSSLATAASSAHANWYNNYGVSLASKEPESLIPIKETFICGVHRAKKFCTIEDNSYWVVVSDTFLLRCLGKEGVEEYVNSTHTYSKSEIEPLF